MFPLLFLITLITYIKIYNPKKALISSENEKSKQL